MNDNRMLPEWKRKWVTALRSGKYNQQFQGHLRDAAGNFSIMGVLCDITKDDPKVKGEWIKWPQQEYSFLTDDDERTGTINLEVYKVTGLENVSKAIDQLYAWENSKMTFIEAANKINVLF